MKVLPYIVFLIALVFALFIVQSVASQIVEGQSVEVQLFMPHAGRIIASPTPTVEVTAAISITEGMTPTATATATPTRTVTPSRTTTPTPTNTPTITLTPTKTGTPTTTPTITPTPTNTMGDGVIVLNSHHDYLNNEGLVTIVGEVRNNTDFNATNMRVIVTLYNNRTDVVDTRDTYVWIDPLPPGEKSCFEVIFLGYPLYNRYEFATTYSNTSTIPRPLTIVDHGALYLQEAGAWSLFGQIRNVQEVAEGEEDVEEKVEEKVEAEPLVYPQIIGTIYDEMGHVLDCMYVNAQADTLAPAETSIWQMTFRPLPQQDGMLYRVQAK